jgi:hypothetical protein
MKPAGRRGPEQVPGPVQEQARVQARAPEQGPERVLGLPLVTPAIAEGAHFP